MTHSTNKAAVLLSKPYSAANLTEFLAHDLSPETPSAGATEGKHTIPNTPIMLEGGRNNALASHAGALRQRGFSEEGIAAALQQMNIESCKPPLSATEVAGIARSIAKYDVGPTDATKESMNDVGNANRFVQMHSSSVRYVPAWKQWLIWNGLFWELDHRGQALQKAKETAKQIFHEAAAQQSDELRKALWRHANQSMRHPRLLAMLALAAADPVVSVEPSQLDAHDMLLGVANGVIDLKTGQLLPSARGLLMTRHSQIKFEPTARAPHFERLLHDISVGDKEFQRFLTTMLGYCITGSMQEQKMFFLHGAGANGKSTFLSVMRELLGDQLAKQTPSETLMSRHNGRTSTNDLARLLGVRLVLASEVEDGSWLAESLIKQLTGGDRITARFLYGEFFEFSMQGKILIAGNHRPVVRGADDGIWRRIVLIPCNAVIAEDRRDPDLMNKLRAELPGILNIAVAGCIRWQKEGLRIPASISSAVSEYRREMDVVGEWLEMDAVLDAKATWKAMDAYASYRVWAEANGYRPMTNASFGRKIKERFKAVRNSAGVTYFGLKKKPHVPQDL